MKLNIKPHLFTYLSISIYLCFNCSISWSQCEESTISCFASTYSNSINSNDINQYSEHCGFTEYDGGEDIVRIEVTSVPATILLNNLNSDLDLFIYGDCSNGLAFLTNCVEFSRNSSINDEVIVVNNTGTYWAIIEGFQGANSAYTLSLVCPNTCNNAEEIYCGETLIRNTLNDSNDFNIFDYSSCYSSSNNFSGSDMIFQFERYSFSQVNYITLQSGQEDLDIFILDNCSPNPNCIDFSVRSVTCGSGQSLSSCYPSGTNVDVVELVNYPAGTYYIVIDGFNSQQAGPFSLSLSCEGINCQGATPIGCNAVVTGSNVGSYNGSSAYDTECFTPSAAQGMFTSGEVLYEFTAPEDGDYDICLTAMPIAIDLELFIISECCPVDVEPGNGGPYYISTSSCLEDCASGATSSNGQETETVSLLAGESIIIIVDGFLGAESQFTLEVKCQDNCDNIEEIYCGETLIRNTLNDSNDFNIFDYSSCYSSSNNFSGSDMIFQFERYSFSQVNYITLQSGQEDLDIFILDNCSPNSNCIDFSVRSVTCGSGQSLSSCYPSGTNVDVVELVNYPAGTYYIVIDGFNSQQAGPFSLSLSCEGINCQGATPIGCNAVVTGSNVGSYNGSSAYDTECFTPSAAQGMFTSGEVLYEFTAPEDGDYDICLTAMPIAIDLELFIISECCPVDVEPGNGGPYYISTSSCLEDCASGATSSNGQETETVSLLAGESIIIIVDGFLGAESQFTLEVKCQDPCDDIIWSVIDDQGNPACSDIVINGISQSSNNTISPNFQPIQTALDFERWEVRNANTGQVLEINTINSQNFNYCCFQPGNEYYICYWYRNIDGCLEFCCIKYELPNNCTFINPRFTGNENNLTYSLDVEGLTSSQSVVAWYDGTNTNPIGSANNISYSPYSTGIRNICCIIYDSVIRGYIMCCRTICVDNPYSCNTFTSSYNQTNDEYTFTAVGSGQNITWYLDAPTSAIIGFNNPQTFRPLLYNVPSGSPFQVSYRYQDSDGCTRFCCKTLTPAPTIDPVIFYIGEECGGIDEIVNIPIRVRKFNEIRGFTFGISLAQNIGVIEDVTVANQELESTLVIYNSIVSSDGQKVDVIGGTSNIVTLPDNSVILMIQVRISNSVFVETDVIFSNVPEPIASVGAGSLSIPITTIDGELCYEESNASINGRIYTEESIGVSDVSVDLNGTMISSVLTDQNGFYDIIDLQSGDEYMITPNRNVINYDAINISDLVRMIDHILATDYIDSPYKLIAADINEDERITISDLTLLIDMILRRSINLDPWIFVDQDYNFTPNSLSITQNYPRNKIVSNLSNDITGLDFIGILKGDLDGSFSGLKEDALPPLKKSCLGFNLQDFNVSENEELDIIISLDTFEFLRSLSAELSFDPNKIEILEVTQSNSALGNNLSVETSNKDQGYLKLLWFTLTSNGESFADGSELMTVKVRGLQQTLLSEAIQISSDFLESETINSANEEGCINLEFEEIISSVEFDETYFSEIKVYPNPWIKETILNIDLPNNETVLFQIRNLEGKLLFKKTLNLVAGTNEIIISDDMINNNHGLMFYSLGNESFQYTNKLIRLK